MPVYRLVVEEGGRTTRHPLAPGDHLVGSAPEAQVRIASPAVSRRHARLSVAPEGVRIEDLGSRNGTRIDGRRVEGEAPLPLGVPLLFGTVEACLERVEAAELETAIELAGAPRSRPPEPERAPPATVGLGSLQAFAFDRLPSILALLEARAEPERVAQAVGATLAEELPCRRVEVVRTGATGGAGWIFAAGEGALDPRSTVRVPAGPFELAAAFVHERQLAAFAPLVATAGRLIGLARPALGGVRAAPPSTPSLPEPPTVDPAMRRLYADAAKVARGDVSVLILGESGTGKELLARYLHAASPRAGAPFVALNCAALPRDLLESELFGIEKGVATGVAPRPGKFELADRGTLFLDEIGDMAPETQAKILRVLQEGEVYRVGAAAPRSADVRVLAATNRDLGAMLESGAFRRDLYHRIADWTAELPPLARRRADIPNLAAHFLTLEARRLGLSVAGVSRAALDALVAADWPGNVRQLAREIARAALFLADGDLLETRHLSPAVVAETRRGATLRERLERVERAEIERELAAVEGDVAAAAERLGLGRSTLYRRIQELGLAKE